ncbi:Hpt domain-containing protein [Mucilaginibacter mali]|uniref:Hpt domain-containing protein n=1 Tax=Mucilaginibacter mali TaxID=2740462 RepID=A0A7D4UKE4_9SPHI|nr:Hpt domain-containing protein [Mucilaginibacter mali]QKJ30522.1 Hpt domain-containing protein [Mucilaginibacter mali]
MSDNQDFDLSFLYEIADGSNEFIVDSIDMFLQQTPELLNTISSAIAAGEWATAGGAAHKLKPNLGFFGMLECQSTMQEVELLCKAGGQDPDTINTKFGWLNSVITNNLGKLAKIKSDTEAML